MFYDLCFSWLKFWEIWRVSAIAEQGKTVILSIGSDTTICSYKFLFYRLIYGSENNSMQEALDADKPLVLW